MQTTTCTVFADAVHTPKHMHHVPLIFEACVFALAVVVCIFLFSPSPANDTQDVNPVYTGGGVGSSTISRDRSGSKIDMTSSISGILPVAGGGTCMSHYTVGDILYASPKIVRTGWDDVSISYGTGVAPRVK